MTIVHEFVGNQRFEVLTRLGQGGMGSVYQVVDRAREVRVALKAIGQVSADGLLRFKSEYRVLSEIRHPNLVELGELFELDQRWFFTMELVDGVDFYSHVRENAERTALEGTLPANDGPAVRGRALAPGTAGFSESRLRRGLAGLVSGVAALHARGFIHRDLKPSNVLVTGQGRVVLIDFGLATAFERLAQGTETRVVGTPAYMSPEQAAGDPIGPASDWYAIGVILYECLTGRLPITDVQPRLLMRKQLEVPPAPRTLVPDVPADLDALCMALLAIDERKRPGVREIYRRLHVDAQVPEQSPSMRLCTASLGEPFVARAAELERLSHALEGTFGGTPRSLTVVGPPGAGKSALLRRFQTDLADGDENTLVLFGHCRQAQTIPYEALDGVMDGLSTWLKAQPDDLVDTLLPADTQLIATTFRALERIPVVRTARSSTLPRDPQERRLRLSMGLRELLRRVAEQWRTVLIVDDMQWSDDDSRHLLRELTRTPDAPPLLIVYSRQRDLDEPPGVHERLDPAADEEIMLHPRETAQASIDGDFESLSAAARALLEVISLAGFPITRSVAAEAAGVAADDLASELRVLRAGRWIRTNGPSPTDMVEPSHSQVERGVLGQLNAERRADLHLSLAMALDDARAEPGKVAHHYRLGGDRHKAAQHLRSAADRALAALAFDHAAVLLRQLLELAIVEPEDERRLSIAWADALACAGRSVESAKAYESAIPSCDGKLALELKRRVAEQYLISDRFDEAMKACSAFLGEFDIKFPATARGALLELAMLRVRVALRGHGFKTRQPDQLAQTELARIDALWAMTTGLTAHDLIRAQVFQTRGLLRALSAGEPYRLSRALALEYVNVLVQNPKREHDAELLMRRAQELATQVRSPHGLGLMHLCRALGEYAGPCRFAAALDGYEQAHAIFRNECQNVSWELGHCIRGVTNCHFAMGRWRLLREAKRDCQEATARGDLELGSFLRVLILSFLALVDDRPDLAAEEVEASTPYERAPSPYERFSSELAKLRVLQYCGRVEEAVAAAANYRKGLVDSLILGAPVIRMQANEAALHNMLLAAEVGHQRALHLEQAARISGRFERDAIGAAVPIGQLGRAAIAYATDQPERALAWLERAENGFLEHQREGDAAAARRRRGQLLGGDEGKALVTSAERWFASQGVRNIPAMCRLLAPGFAQLEFGGSP